MPDGSDIDALKAALAVAEAKAIDAEAKATDAEVKASEAEARAANAAAKVSDAEAQIAALKLMVEKLRRALYGQRSERKQRLLDQLELQLDELEASATEDELAAEQAAAGTTQVKGFTRRRSGRKPFPEHLPRERVVVPAPSACGCCGSEKLSKIGEDITETLEVIPRQWKVIQTVREKFTCRHCENISQPPAPFHPTPRGWAGPNLLAMILFEKYGQHQPLNRQRDRYAREGVDLSLSTLADQVGACTVALKPLHDLIAAHVLAAERLHGDDTPVPVLARGKTATGRAWVYVRDDRPFGGPDPPAALFRYSRNRSGDHPVEHLHGFAGILQADSFAGYNRLYAAGRSPGPVTEIPCWAYVAARLREIYDSSGSEIAAEGLRRIAELYAIEAEVRGSPPERRLAERQARSAPLVQAFGDWLKQQRARVSPKSRLGEKLAYIARHWDGLQLFLTDGRVELDSDSVENLVRPIALSRKNALFAGHDEGAAAWGRIASLIETAKLNGVEPYAWLKATLEAIAAGRPNSRIDDLMPWNFKPPSS